MCRIIWILTFVCASISTLRAEEAKKTMAEVLRKKLMAEEEALLAKLPVPQRVYVMTRLEKANKPRLDVNNPDTMRKGAIGELYRGDSQSFEVNQVIDETNMLISDDDADTSLWVEGAPTTDLTDDTSLTLEGAMFEVKGTKQYETALGTSRTVRHLVYVDYTAAEAIAMKIRTLRTYRVWEDATGRFATIARFASFEKGSAVLRTRENKYISVPLIKLSKTDQIWVRAYVRNTREGAEIVEALTRGE
jgi:hypothetical protein